MAAGSNPEKSGNAVIFHVFYSRVCCIEFSLLITKEEIMNITLYIEGNQARRAGSYESRRRACKYPPIG